MNKSEARAEISRFCKSIGQREPEWVPSLQTYYWGGEYSKEQRVILGFLLEQADPEKWEEMKHGRAATEIALIDSAHNGNLAGAAVMMGGLIVFMLLLFIFKP